jgi:phosphotransferase system IIB component
MEQVLPWQHGKIKKCATRLRSEMKQVLPWQHGKIKKCATRLRSEMEQVLWCEKISVHTDCYGDIAC